ncbi:MAG: short-chain fatty acyl-CoA regulator family protein [Acetobacteraceae bacterium]|nr:short-chain fatty acyl-CoA regulator family protein [Acetobacteraceae bacterium]
MSRPLIGRSVRRIRLERGLSQQALAVKLGISASYLNLIEHDQRGVTASLLIKLSEVLAVDLATLSGSAEKQSETQLREVFADPLLAADAVPDAEIETIAAGSPTAARAILALYRALRVARDDSGGIALPSGRRILLPTEEVRDFFNEHANHFPVLEAAAERLTAELGVAPAESNHAIAERLRRVHGMSIQVGPLPGAIRRYDPENRRLMLSELLPRESRGFHLAFQLALVEGREAVEEVLATAAPSSPEASALMRVAFLNYIAGALLMPYGAFLAAAAALRHDMDALAARFGVSFEQACNRLCSLQRSGARGVPFFFLRVDPAGNVSKRFSAAGFPFARFGGTCPRWVAHSALSTPGVMRVQVAQLPDGATFLCFARAVESPAMKWGEPAPVHVLAMGCDISHADQITYADGVDVERAVVGIGLSCRLCDRPDCRSRAFPPLEHRLALDPLTTGLSPYQFEAKKC